MLTTRAATITRAELERPGDDHILRFTLTYTDGARESVDYLIQESVHGNDVLVKLLKSAGYGPEKRFDRLFSDLTGSRLRVRVDEEGTLQGVGHRLKNTFFMWDDSPVHPIE